MAEWETIVSDIYSRYRKECRRDNIEPKSFDDFLLRFKGDKGDKGDPGIGVPGRDGEDGIRGPVGLQGDKGDKGDAGIRGEQGPRGYKGQKGETGKEGLDGANGWTPAFAVRVHGERRVLQVVDWFGGVVDKPQSSVYLSESGFVEDIESATDIRGSVGPQPERTGVPKGFGGGSGDSIYIQDDQPTVGGQYLWIQTNADTDGNFTFWVAA